MDSNKWDEIQGLFHQCEKLSLDEQEIFLKNLEEKDSDLAKEVKKLLEAYYSSGTFLEDDILEHDFIKAGDRVGPWKINREIGRGGMSIVYHASRADGQFERDVAIKFLHGLIPGRSMHKRLQLEQNILAKLHHKNIAQLFDAGVTDEGRPYFILEYIDGKPITEWCYENKIGFSQRLDIFAQVCEAVQFAHQRLIVHRDLKPTNILVDNNGSVKLLDFGIAKILEEDPQEGAALTRTGQYLMTPEYASPEQVRGESITTATDVYALGLILCQILTGSLPYNLSEKSPMEISSIISETYPTKPSTLVGKGLEINNEESKRLRTGLNSKYLKKELRGDLDNIIMKALRKESERRYGSADQLLQDIRHYQKNEPISARPESAGYLTKKFVQRNRTAVSAAVIIVFILIGTVIFSLIQARNTEIERQKTEQVNAFLQEMLASPNPFEDGRDVRVIDILDQTAERMDNELDLDPSVAAAVHHTLGVTYRELGDLEKASVHLAEALKVRNNLYTPPHPDISDSQAEYGKLEQKKGNYAVADSLLRLAFESDLSRLGKENTTVAIRISDRGVLKWEMGDLESAEQLLRESLELEQQLRDSNDVQLAVSLGNLATLLLDQGYHNEALKLYNRELGIYRSNYENDQHPSIPQVLSHIGIIYDDLEEYEEARINHEQALELFRELKGEDHADVAYAMNNLASVLTNLGEPEEALKMQQESAEIYESIYGNEHPNVGIQYNNIAYAKRTTGDLEGAIESYKKAIDIWEKGLPEDHLFLGYGYHNLGSVLMLQNHPQEALPNFQRAYEIRVKQLSTNSSERGVTTSMLGDCLATLNRTEEAEPLLIEGYQILLQSLGENHTSTQEAEDRLKEFLSTQNRLEDFETITNDVE